MAERPQLHAGAVGKQSARLSPPATRDEVVARLLLDCMERQR
jgi:hypothetical protein